MSSAWIHGMYWRPPATGPPMPRRKKGSIFASAPPSVSSTTPVRSVATRSPCSAARAASRSHATHTWARKSSPGAASSVTGSSPRGP